MQKKAEECAADCSFQSFLLLVTASCSVAQSGKRFRDYCNAKPSYIFLSFRAFQEIDIFNCQMAAVVNAIFLRDLAGEDMDHYQYFLEKFPFIKLLLVIKSRCYSKS